MGAYKYIKHSLQASYKERNDVMKNRLIDWRRGETIVRVGNPTNLARARELGYRAKPGVVIVRVRVRKGLTKREKPVRGRKPSKYGRFYAYAKSLQARAEERAARKYRNCEVLNSYFVGEDGMFKFYETILLDRENPSVNTDPQYMQVLSQRNRVYRGLTSAGRKHRGIIEKGFGSTINRPSVRSQNRGAK